MIEDEKVTLDIKLGFWPLLVPVDLGPFFRFKKLENGFQLGLWRFFFSVYRRENEDGN